MIHPFFKYWMKESEKATVTIADETDDNAKVIDLSIHTRTTKTVPFKMKIQEKKQSHKLI